MATNKTTATQASVTEFIGNFDLERRKDCRILSQMMREATGSRAKMWGASIVGFGTYHYRYESGREGDSFLSGFSPRKSNLTVYVMEGFDQNKALMKKLGKHKTGQSCLYINKLDDVDLSVLKELINKSVATMKKRYPDS